jgi:membrane-associated protein
MNPLSANSIIESLGLAGVLIVLFLETGLLLGLVLPGDSLLFVAGVAASGSALKAAGVQLDLRALLIGAPIAAIIGSEVGRNFGARFGRPLFDRPEGRVFSRAKVERAEKFLARYGYAKALLLARFIPVVRTLINPLAGIVQMPKRIFTKWNIVGAIIWTESVILIGYVLGEKLKGSVDKYLLPIVGMIIVISFLPIIFSYLKERKN